jgi:radical SAM superfamily enzyme YgiQ (UPF0313 family)
MVYPSSYDASNRLIKAKRALFPSRATPYLAALTPTRYDVRVVDELVDDVDFKTDADLIALTGMTRHLPRAMEIAAEFRKRGKRTIAGGIGVSMMPDKVQDAFDCVVTGEAEEIWEGILADFENGRLRPRYRSEQPPDLTRIPSPRFDLLNADKYVKIGGHPILPVETGRGCPRNCNYCTVTQFFGGKIRYRPIAAVVDEIKTLGAKYVSFCDDNIGADRARARELFTALKPLGIRWFGQFEGRIARQPELLRLAAESGCDIAFVGIESLNAENLRALNKPQNAALDVQEMARAFKSVGIRFIASVMFGMDKDTTETMQTTVAQLLAAKVDVFIPWLITPIPGTRFHAQAQNSNRILHENYSLYDGWHPVLLPQQMSPEELERSYWAGLDAFYSWKNILKRLWQGKKGRLPNFLFGLYLRSQARRRVHPLTSSRNG